MTTKYPKVNYIGNKEKLVTWLVDNFPIAGGIVLDAFSGGCSVSYELKKRGYEVITNDVLYSSFVVAKSIIENKDEQLGEEEIKKALSIQITSEVREQYSWIENKLYFSEEVDELVKLVEYSKSLDHNKKYIMQSLIRRAMIRKLPYSRMNVPWNNIVKLRDEDYSYEKYGRRRAYHNVPFSQHILENLSSYNASVFDNGLNNTSHQEDILKLADTIKSVDLVYLDPPYPGTMNKYKSFYGSFDRLFGKEISYMDLTRRETFLETMLEVVRVFKNKTRYIVLSLNSNSTPSISEISEAFSEFGTIEVIERKHNYQVSGKKNKNNNLEQLLILQLDN